MKLIAIFGLALAITESAPASSAGADSVFWPEDSGYVNVKTLGAAGDGKTDDTAAIQRAYAGKNRAIYFPPGTYLVSDTITATPKNETLFCSQDKQTDLHSLNTSDEYHCY